MGENFKTLRIVIWGGFQINFKARKAGSFWNPTLERNLDMSLTIESFSLKLDVIHLKVFTLPCTEQRTPAGQSPLTRVSVESCNTLAAVPL